MDMHSSATTVVKDAWLRGAEFLAAFLMLSSLAFAQGTSPVPWIANPLVPGVVKPGSGAFTLIMNGTGFVIGSTVYWNGSARATTYVSSGQLMAAILAADVTSATSGSVTVHNPGGTISNTALLLVTNPVTAPSFGASGIPQTLNENTGYYGMLAGDYDGSGLQSVIVNQGLVLEVAGGLGNGSFQFPVNYTIPGSTEAYGEVLADFTNNGLEDVVLSVGNTNTQDVFLANPDGTLQAPLQNPTNFVAATVADFSGDGRRDLAGGYYVGAQGGVGIMFGKGDGTFEAPALVPLTNAASSVAVGDFNRDGIPDIAAGNFAEGGGEDPYVSILLGQGDGSFQGPVNYTVGRAPESMAVADFNGDGYPDIAVIDAGSYATFYVLLNNGDGSFAPAVQYTGTLGPSYDRITTGDFNGDGKLDLTIYNGDYCTNNCLLIFLGNGDGTFQPALYVGTRQDTSGSYQGSMLVDDFNGDGMLDIASVTGNGPYVFIQTPGPSPTIRAGSYSFGPQAVGTQSQSQNVILQQPGSTTITILSATVTGDFQIPSNVQCVLNPGNSGECGFGVSFTPTATGTRTGTIAITSTGGTQYVSLIGTGVTGTVGVTVAPTSISYASQVVKTISAYQSVVITNTGTGTLDLTNISLTGAAAGDFKLVNEDCGASIAPGMNCFVEIGFQPTMRGVRSAALSIADNASNSPQTVALSGVGTTNSLSASSLSFGSVGVGASSSLTLTLTNVGGKTTSVSQVGIVGRDKEDFSESNTCGTSLPPQKTCTFIVTFTPTVTGPRKASLTFTSDGSGKNAMTTISLLGDGT